MIAPHPARQIAGPTRSAPPTQSPTPGIRCHGCQARHALPDIARLPRHCATGRELPHFGTRCHKVPNATARSHRLIALHPHCTHTSIQVRGLAANPIRLVTIMADGQYGLCCRAELLRIKQNGPVVANPSSTPSPRDCGPLECRNAAAETCLAQNFPAE